MKNRYPLSLIEEMLNLLGKARIDPKLDVRGVYNLLRAKEGDENKSGCLMRYGLYEATLMQFGTGKCCSGLQRLS
jgi:hypothetical protein